MEVVFKNVCKKYGSVTAVSNLNLTIAKGSFHFLLGPSGCGKTTTLRMLAGLEKSSSGQIFFDGQDMTNKPSSERGIGMVFQNYALWPHMTVRQNIEYGLKIRKLSSRDMGQRVGEVLEMTRLTKLQTRLPGQLSGGQQQRVALARALAIRPTVLLLDEPLSNLDAKLRSEMRDNISRIHRETGITTFYVTHDRKEALSMGSMITVMHHGVEVQSGTPRELYSNPASTFLAGFISDTNIISGTYSGTEGDAHLVQTEFGTLKCARKNGEFKQGDKVNLSIRPGAFKVIENGSPAKHEEVNSLTLPLEAAAYLGEIEQLNFTYADSRILRVNLYNPQIQHEPGSSIKCAVNPKNIIVLPFEEIES